jgi:SNF2 family DNA or RNA helicase
MLLRRRDDVIKDLPPLIEQTIEVEMTKLQRRIYDKLKKEYRVWVEEAGQDITAWSQDAMVTKLRRVACGVDVELPTVQASGKLDMLRQVVRDHQLPAVVFVWHRATAEASRKALESLGLSVAIRSGIQSRKAQDEAVRRLNAGKVDVLVASLATSSESLNLQVASTAILMEQSYRPSTNLQAVRRLHRLGQTRPVQAITLVTRDSCDEGMRELLASKTDQQMKALRPRDYLARL